MDTASRHFERIAEQGVNFPLKRGVPAWSPLGNELAWVEYGTSAETYNGRAQLVVYNFDTETTRNVGFVNLGFQDGGISLPELQWGSTGISYQIFTYVESGDAQIQLHILDPNTRHVSQFVLYSSQNPFAEGDVAPLRYVWVEHNARSMI